MLQVLKQSKVDEMNEAIANYVIKSLETLSPLATPDEVSSIAKLASIVNDAPKAIQMFSEPIKPFKRKRRR